MPMDVGRELTSVFLTLYDVLYHMNISLLHHKRNSVNDEM